VAKLFVREIFRHFIIISLPTRTEKENSNKTLMSASQEIIENEP